MIHIDIDDVHSELHLQEPHNILDILKKHLNVKVPGAEYLYAYKSKQWDGTVNLWELLHESSNNLVAQVYSIRTGVLPRILEALAQYKIPFTMGFDSRSLASMPVKFNTTQVPLRDYQKAALTAALKNTSPHLGWWPRGVLEMATGSGKTETAVAMYETNPVPTFFLVHRKDLLIQAKERFEKYGHRVGVIGDGQFSPEAPLNIATMQTVRRIMKGDDASVKFEALNYLIKSCRQIFVDECHLVASSLDKGNEFVEIVDMFRFASFRFGLTGTAFLRSQYDNALLEGVTGQSVYAITSKQLVDMGFLTQPKVFMRRVPGTMRISMDWKKSKSNQARTEHWRKVEEDGIKFNEPRTKLIIEEATTGPFPALILVKTVEQANFIKALYRHMTQKELPFVSGADSAQDRRAAVKALNEGRIPVLMATTIFDEGVDVPALAKVILASGGKSAVKLIQRVGRSLRLHKNKKEAIIIDFCDGHHSLLAKHADERRKVWRDQQFQVFEQ